MSAAFRIKTYQVHYGLYNQQVATFGSFDAALTFYTERIQLATSRYDTAQLVGECFDDEHDGLTQDEQLAVEEAGL